MQQQSVIDDVDWALAKARARSTLTSAEADTYRELVVAGEVTLTALHALIAVQIESVDTFKVRLVHAIETRSPFYRTKFLQLIGVPIGDEPTRVERREAYAQMRPYTLRLVQAMCEAAEIISVAVGQRVSLPLEQFFEIALVRAGRASTLADVLEHLRAAAGSYLRLKTATDHVDAINAAHDFCTGNRGFHTGSRRAPPPFESN